MRKRDYSRLNLGDLVKKMHMIAIDCPNVLKSRIPKSSQKKYQEYMGVVDELNERERRYKSVPEDLQEIANEFMRIY